MNHTDYPALYQSSDELSLSSEAFFGTLFVHLLLLIATAVISVINSPLPELAIVQALVLFGALACSVYLFSARPDRYWYAGHAVAESIKTVTWRFHIPTDLVVAQEASDVESSSRLDFLLLHNLRRRFVA